MGNFYNYIIAFSSALGGFLFGYEIGIIDQVLQMRDFGLKFGILKLNTTIPYDYSGSLPYEPITYETPEKDDLKGNITFTFLIGCAVGALIVSLLADSIGRKRSILAGATLFSAGGFVQAFCPDLISFYTGRIVSGLGIGLLSMSAPLYISEIAPSSVRGRMVAIQQLMITIGILVAALINTAIRSVENGNEREWRLSLVIQCVPGVILMAIMLFMPFSPRWLEGKNRHEESRSTLARIRSASPNSADIMTEYQEIKDGVMRERMIGSAAWSELLKRGIINRLLIGVTLQIFQQWTGINFILYYASSLFGAMGFDYETASTKLNIINAAINVIGTLPGMYLIERVGRRKLLIYGGFGMGFSHFMVCIFVGLSKNDSSYAWGAVIFVYIFILFFAATWGPTVWVYQSEIFPQRIRAKGTGISTFFNWGMNAVIGKVTPLLLGLIDYKLYLIFGVTGVSMAIFTIVFVPETMGKSLEDMDDLFGILDTNVESVGEGKRVK